MGSSDARSLAQPAACPKTCTGHEREKMGKKTERKSARSMRPSGTVPTSYIQVPDAGGRGKEKRADVRRLRNVLLHHSHGTSGR